MRLSLPVVLASGSPRRRELLARLVPEFEVLVAGVDEDALTESDPWRTAERLAQAKAEAVLRLRRASLVIGGDTVVALPWDRARPERIRNNSVIHNVGSKGFPDALGTSAVPGEFIQLAKPADVQDAVTMLRRLSGRAHAVITGVCLAWGEERRTFSDTSWVTFRELEDEEIKAYVRTGEPMDKAGGYAIQGGAAGFVERLEGSLTNVVGLPLERLEDALREVVE